jgi:hypothetical protein
MTNLEKYYTFILEHKPTIKIGEVSLKPEYDKEYDKIFWHINNPNDESINVWGLKGYVDELLHTFSEYVGKKFYKSLKSRQEILLGRSFVNEKDKKILLEKAKEVNSIEVDGTNFSVTPFRVETDIRDDEFTLVVSMVVEDTDDKVILDEFISKLQEVYDTDKWFDYQDSIFSGLQDFIWNRPTLFDKSYMLVSLHTNFFTPQGKQIKYW